MTLRDITAEEWLTVREIRANNMTGYTVHGVPFSAKIGDGKPRGYYIWKMGTQPGGAMRRALTAGCPVKAAEKFLAIFAPNEPDCSGYHDMYRLPVARVAIAKAEGGAS
jgi:hypothetical protein